METHRGSGFLIVGTDQTAVPVTYEYVIDRHNRVWHGSATRTDAQEPIMPPAGPAVLVTESDLRSPVNYYHRRGGGDLVIVFTGRGAPPGE